MPLIVGVAGWSIPASSKEDFPSAGSHLERYGARLPAVEINSSFYRPHRRSTYERWAASVPDHFRFAVKLPGAITHERRFRNCEPLLQAFADETAGLGVKRGPVLVQLPPSFIYPGALAAEFLEAFRSIVGGRAVLEPRHASWFTPDADHLLQRSGVARVAADPALSATAARPGGWSGMAYFRLHGSPRIYDTPYERRRIESHAEAAAALGAGGAEVWTIFDNTMHGAATRNALELLEMLRPPDRVA